MRAVLGQWAGGGLPLPQDKAPPTVTRRVIHFGPEPCQWGSGFSYCRVGVGRRILEREWLRRTPPRKIHAQFQRHKHTSLSLKGDESSGVRRYFAQITILVTVVVTLGRR